MKRPAGSGKTSAHAPTEAAGAQPFLSTILNDQRQRWRRGERVSVESYLKSMLDLQADREGLLDLICNEVVLRAEKGDVPELGEYLKRFQSYQEKFPDFAAQLRFLFEVEGVIQAESVSMSATIPRGEDLDSRSSVAPPPPPPERMIGRYEIHEELGRGAMGVVYRARQPGLNRIVALKMILSGDYAAPQDLARFRSEAEAVARLQHPHIVQIYEVGEHDGLPFFSLEFIGGGSLAKKLAGAPMRAREAAQLTETLARAVHYAHQRGVIHRDLKPGNVLLNEEGTPKITDFGLAKRVQAEADSNIPVPETKSGDIMGTPSYMAPEQALGHTGAIGPVTDVYALGAILYELLTGRPPFRGANTVETLHQVVFDDLVPPGTLQPKLPRDLETICLKCLQKDARKRYGSAEELAEDLRRFLAGETIHARRTGIWERGIKFTKRRPALAFIIGITPLFCAALLSVSIYALDKERKERVALAAARIAEERAKEEELQARRQAYRAQLSRAWDKWQETQIGMAIDFLEELKPKSADQKDLRGFEWYYLNKLCHSDVGTIPGAHTTVAFNPDGQTLAAAGPENTVKIWDANTGKELRTLAGHDGPVKTLAFQAGGRLLASGSEDRTVRIWEVITGRQVSTLHDHKRGVSAIAFRPDGLHLVSIGDDARVIIWDVKEAKKLATFNGHNSRPVYAIAYSPDGRSIASAGGDGKVLIWEENTRKIEMQLLGEEEDPVIALAFSPDGQRLATGTLRGNLTLWPLENKEEPKGQSLPGHEEAIKAIAFSSDGTFMATGSIDRTVKLWDGREGQLIRIYRGHLNGVTAVAFSPDVVLLASAGADPAVKVWDLRQDQETVALRGGDKSHTAIVHGIAFSPDGRNLASAAYDKRVKIWDTSTGEELASIEGHTDRVNSVVYSADGTRLATGSADRTIKIWTLKENGTHIDLAGHTDSVESVAFSPDGRQLVSASRDGTIRVWDISQRKAVQILSGHGGAVMCACYSPDGQRIVSGGEDHTVRVWDAKTGREIWKLTDHKDAVDVVAYSPNDRYFASGGHDRTIKVWEANTGKLLCTLLEHERPVHGLVFSPDSEHLISVSPDRWIIFWDIAGRQETFPLRGDPNWDTTYCVAISPDGKRLAWGGGRKDRGEVKLLDASAGWTNPNGEN
jgi:WD40 repeat protein/serine/threonine protein kinase